MTSLLTTLAHAGHASTASGFEAGFFHPWLGLDHLLAMITVGLLAVRVCSRKALWLVPAGFIAGMLVGGGASVAGVGVPGVEWVIAGSVVVLGLIVAALPEVRLSAAMSVVALAGLFHGHAHLTEMAGTVPAYATGMVLATALLHGLGVAAGVGLTAAKFQPAVRFAGAAMAIAFAVTLAV